MHPQVTVQARRDEVCARVHALLQQGVDGQDVRLRGVGVAEPHARTTAQVLKLVVAVVVASDDVAAPAQVGVAHRDRVRAPPVSASVWA